MDYFSMEYVEQLVDAYAVPFGINLLLAAAIFVVGKAVAKAITRTFRHVLEKRMEPSLVRFLADLAYALMLMIVVIAALERLGVQTTAAVAVLGAAGLAVGFALQGSLGNFAAGVMVMIFRPYKVGDVIVAAGHTGKVQEIKIFNTILLTPDNRTIIAPNGQIVGGTIENITAQDTRRIDLVFGVGYGDDLKKAKDLLAKVVAEESRVLPEPAPQIAVMELADSSVNFVCRPWVKTADYWDVRFAITEQVKLRFDAEGISIPFPQQDVHLHKVA